MELTTMSRRFLLLPLLALALLGPADNTGTNPKAEPSVTASPTPDSPDEIAAATLIDALETQQVFYVDHLVFASGTGGELETLKELDPSIAWGTAVVVQEPAEEGLDAAIVVLRAPVPGGSLCLSLVTTERDAGLWYARVAGTSKCPKARAGMRGWLADESAWGL